MNHTNLEHRIDFYYMQEPQKSTKRKLDHLFKILGNFLSVKNNFLTSCTVKLLGSTVFTNKTKSKRVTWKEIRSCLLYSSVPIHSTLQREVYDSAEMVLLSALNFGNNFLQETERIWKQFVTVEPRPPPLTKVILTIDLSRAWMAFSSFLNATVALSAV